MPDQQTTWLFKFLQTQEQEPPAPAKLKGDAPGSLIGHLIGRNHRWSPTCFRGLRSEGKNGKMRLMHSSNGFGLFLVVLLKQSLEIQEYSTEALGFFVPWCFFTSSQKKCVFLLLSQKQSVRRKLRQSKTMRCAISLRLVVSITKEWIPDEVCWFLATRRSGV